MVLTDWIQTGAVIYFAWQQNQIFKRQNEIFANQVGRPATQTNTSQVLKLLERYWPMAVFVAITGYDIYDRHANENAPNLGRISLWWHYSPLLLLMLIAACVGLIIGSLIRAKAKPLGHQIEASNLSTEQRKRIKLVGVLESKAGKADWLAMELERVWLVYNKDHETLLRPLGKNALPDVNQKERDKRLSSFRSQYYGYIGEVRYHVPDFHSSIMDGPSPYRDIEYPDLREELKKHANMLRKLANEIEQSNLEDLSKAAKEAPAPQVKKEEPPTILALKPRSVFLHEGQLETWYEASKNLGQATQGIVIPFKNIAATVIGRETPSVGAVSAHMVFRNLDLSEEIPINHGAWLGRYQHFIPVKPGETQSLIIALKLTFPFVTLNNPNAVDPTSPFVRKDAYVPCDRITIFDKGEIEITLVNHGVTIFHGLFDYSLSTEKMTITQRPESSQ
jgi:hypothetical protein